MRGSGWTQRIAAAAVLLLAGTVPAAPAAFAQALPFLPAGDAYLRHEIELNHDEGRIPLSTTWPLPTLDVPEESREQPRAAMQPGSAQDAGWFIAGASQPTRLRTFEDTPREKGEAGVQSGWTSGDYAGGAIRLSYAVQPQDQMHYRYDGTYASWRFANWWVTLGAQERWWGPGWDGSLILSNNSRPMPGITLDRASARAPRPRWLHWIGPWRLTTFMDRMEDRRPDINKALFWGMRLTAQPLHGLELGLSRTAEWCGTGRPCGLGTFWHLFTARSSALINESGPNPNINAKPGAQDGAIDLRWHVGNTPLSFYWQEYGQTFDSGNYRPRLTLQMFGMEVAGRHIADGRTRTFIEFADTTCGDVSIHSTDKPVYGCAYENSLYAAGYRYRGRAIGDAMDRDGRRITLGVLQVDAANRFWQLRLRKLELNRGGEVRPGLVDQTVSTVPETVWEFAPEVDGAIGDYRYQLGGALDRTRTLGRNGLHGTAFLGISHPW
jgi:hypothetical protein